MWNAEFLAMPRCKGYFLVIMFGAVVETEGADDRITLTGEPRIINHSTNSVSISGNVNSH